jgi:Delta7-sterol 5-desaturase
MNLWNFLLTLTGGEESLRVWFALFLGFGLVTGIATGWFKARKIQPKGFKWKTFRNEAIFGTVNVFISGAIIGGSLKWLTANGWIIVNHAPTNWWVILAEYALYFVAFDTWFYWLHRAMHVEPFYKWIHKLHHFSTAPNLLTNISVNPLESLINGGFVPLFLTVVTVHEQAFALITPTNVFIGFMIHSGYEFFPRWWNKSWATKWMISATFHDQHHKYFNFNFGGYTTLWDRLCGTMRPKFEADFEKLKTRGRIQAGASAQTGTPAA